MGLHLGKPQHRLATLKPGTPVTAPEHPKIIWGCRTSCGLPCWILELLEAVVFLLSPLFLPLGWEYLFLPVPSLFWRSWLVCCTQLRSDWYPKELYLEFHSHPTDDNQLTLRVWIHTGMILTTFEMSSGLGGGCLGGTEQDCLCPCPNSHVESWVNH